jgi:hypothetical protein
VSNQLPTQSVPAGSHETVELSSAVNNRLQCLQCVVSELMLEAAIDGEVTVLLLLSALGH